MLQGQLLAILLSLVVVYFICFPLEWVGQAQYFSSTCFLNDNYRSPKPNHTAYCEQRLHRCGDQTAFKLKFPFRFEDDPDFCGYPNFELSCNHNRTALYLENSTLYYYVDSINYENGRIRVLDPGVRKDNCSTLPLNPITSDYEYNGPFTRFTTSLLILVSCKEAVKSKSPLYVETASCNITAKNETSDQSESSDYSNNYAVVGKNLAASDIKENCTINTIVPIDIQSLDSIGTANISYPQIHSVLANGFDFRWGEPLEIGKRKKRSFLCYAMSFIYIYNNRWETYFYRKDLGDYITFGWRLFAIAIVVRSAIGILLLFAFLIRKWRRRHLSIYDEVEEFLHTNNLIPIRYSYKEIKAMTNNFKDKLGEGGYGLVYKGKLRSGNFVAVKMLNKSKANGQEFINEVATIGRIHHVNVVRLVGFCVSASKRALVYDYMSNGSLDKFIFSSNPNGNSLSLKKGYEIVKGVARGIEYLHQGCNMQILHFDIKPHNILLDENFVPKVSDFGLAKLYPVQDGYVATLTAARGTLGYMAPELFYKKIGRVSYKADVYSFGMLLMDMAGRRNANSNFVHSSEIFFPSWIYDKIDQIGKMEFGDHATDDEAKGIAKKLILIALWCVQMTPIDRPSMREVLEMLEGNLEGLELPTKPLFYPPDSPVRMQSDYSSFEDSMEEPLCRSITLEVE